MPQSPLDLAMERYAQGEEEAFAEVYDGLAPRLFGFLLRQTRDRHRAEDLLQQTLLQIHRARGSFLAGAEVLPWAFAIARRLHIDGHRRGRREPLAPSNEGVLESTVADDPAPSEVVEAHELAQRFQAALDAMPEAQRMAFQLVKQEGLTMAEAAQVLGTTVSAVKLRAHRAYQALRLVLGDAVEEEGA